MCGKSRWRTGQPHYLVNVSALHQRIGVTVHAKPLRIGVAEDFSDSEVPPMGDPVWIADELDRGTFNEGQPCKIAGHGSAEELDRS